MYVISYLPFTAFFVILRLINVEGAKVTRSAKTGGYPETDNTRTTCHHV